MYDTFVYLHNIVHNIDYADDSIHHNYHHQLPMLIEHLIEVLEFSSRSVNCFCPKKFSFRSLSSINEKFSQDNFEFSNFIPNVFQVFKINS